MQIKANGIQLEVEERGPKDGPAIVLIRGLGTQMVYWPDELLDGFAKRGFRTIAFDNRDVGLSQRCPKEGVTGDGLEIIKLLENDETPKIAYTLDDMAQDVVGLMDALEIQKAHVFGISMGGGIAQALATNHSSRCHSVTIVMSAARFLGVGLLRNLLAFPLTRQEHADEWVQGNKDWGSPGFPMSEDELHAMANRAYDRGYDDQGVNRQALTTSQSGDRREQLKTIKLPCFVIHGSNDTLIPPMAGQEIASLIPDAAYMEIEGMGHTIPPSLAPQIVDDVAAFIGRL